MSVGQKELDEFVEEFQKSRRPLPNVFIGSWDYDESYILDKNPELPNNQGIAYIPGVYMNALTLIHDLGHAVDLYIRGKEECIRMVNFGFKDLPGAEKIKNKTYWYYEIRAIYTEYVLMSKILRKSFSDYILGSLSYSNRASFMKGSIQKLENCCKYLLDREVDEDEIFEYIRKNHKDLTPRSIMKAYPKVIDIINSCS